MSYMGAIFALIFIVLAATSLFIYFHYADKNPSNA